METRWPEKGAHENHRRILAELRRHTKNRASGETGGKDDASLNPPPGSDVVERWHEPPHFLVTAELDAKPPHLAEQPQDVRRQ